MERVKENLHLTLAMSPIGDAFRNRLRMFPSLINCCTIDWYFIDCNITLALVYIFLFKKKLFYFILCIYIRFTVWPEDALEKVAEFYLQDMNIDHDISTACVKICKEFHTTTREASDK